MWFAVIGDGPASGRHGPPVGGRIRSPLDYKHCPPAEGAEIAVSSMLTNPLGWR